MIDVHVHEQVGDNWRFIGSDAALDEVPKFQALLKLPSTDNLNTAEIFGYLFRFDLTRRINWSKHMDQISAHRTLSNKHGSRNLI